MKIKHPELLLIFLAPFTSELISGSTPFILFIKPVIFFTYLGFYGLGVLLIREVVARRNLNYISLLILGAGFGIFEEGLIIRSWFDPTWMAGVILSKSLRIFGVNFLQPFFNITYHSLISITANILLVESLSLKKGPWISSRLFKIIFLLFLLFSINLRRLNSYPLKLWQYLFLFVLLGITIFFGLKRYEIKRGTKIYSPWIFWLVGLLFPFLHIFIFLVLGFLEIKWFIILGLFFILLTFYSFFFKSVDWRKVNPRHLFSIAAGFISGLPLPLLFTLKIRSLKMPNFLTGLIFAGFLVFIYKKLPRNLSPS